MSHLSLAKDSAVIGKCWNIPKECRWFMRPLFFIWPRSSDHKSRYQKNLRRRRRRWKRRRNTEYSLRLFRYFGIFRLIKFGNAVLFSARSLNANNDPWPLVIDSTSNLIQLNHISITKPIFVFASSGGICRPIWAKRIQTTTNRLKMAMWLVHRPLDGSTCPGRCLFSFSLHLRNAEFNCFNNRLALLNFHYAVRVPAGDPNRGRHGISLMFCYAGSISRGN